MISTIYRRIASSLLLTTSSIPRKDSRIAACMDTYGSFHKIFCYRLDRPRVTWNCPQHLQQPSFALSKNVMLYFFQPFPFFSLFASAFSCSSQKWWWWWFLCIRFHIHFYFILLYLLLNHCIQPIVHAVAVLYYYNKLLLYNVFNWSGRLSRVTIHPLLDRFYQPLKVLCLELNRIRTSVGHYYYCRAWDSWFAYRMECDM